MSTLLLNTLTGKTSAGSIVVTGEGGSNTTNLQQGIAKSWVLGTNAAALTDSFNVSGGTDNSTGDYSYAVSTSFSSANYSAPSVCAEDDVRFGMNKGRATGSYRHCYRDHGSTLQDVANAVVVLGDLA